jgi:hypothetical protein
VGDPRLEVHKLWGVMTGNGHENNCKSKFFSILLDLLQQCKSHAVNLNHTKITAEDVIEGEKNYSNDLVESISLEIRDVWPSPSIDVRTIIYEFVGANSKLTSLELNGILSKNGVTEVDRDKLAGC